MLQVLHRQRLAPLASAVAAAIGCAAGSSALAQESGGIETVIVTSTFIETDVQDTPIAVTAVSAEMLEARGQYNVVDVGAQAPNVQLSSYGQDGGTAMTAHIRGIGQIDFNYAMEPGVGIYVDDVYYPNMNGSMVELLDVERVEILRGPQGTLAGRNSIGGALKIFSQEPSLAGDDYGNVELSIGDYNLVGIRAGADFTFVPDKFALRVAGTSRTRDGYVTRVDYRCVNPTSPIPSYSAGDRVGCELGTLGGESYTGGRATFVWTPSDTLKVKFIGDIINTNSESPAMILWNVRDPAHLTNGYGEGIFHDINGDLTDNPPGDRVYYSTDFITWGPNRPSGAVLNDPYVTYATFLDPFPQIAPGELGPGTFGRPYSPVAVDPRSELDQEGFSVHVDWDINDRISLMWVSANREYKDLWTQDTDGAPLNVQMLTQTLRHKHETHEVRVSGFTDMFDYTIGAFLVDQYVATHEANVNLAYTGLNFIHGPDQTPSESKAIFAHGTWHATDTLNVGVGVRSTDDDKTYTYFRSNPDGTVPGACVVAGPPANPLNPPNCALFPLFNVSESFSSSRTDYRVAIDYHLSDDIMVYGQSATGYKGGGINPRPFIIPQIGVFTEEELTTNELGFKSLLADGLLRLNVAYFSNEYEDIQLQLLSCQPVPAAPCLKPENVGDGESDGIEVELEIMPTDTLLIDFSFSTLDFEYTAINNPASAVTLDMVTPWTPDSTWSFGVQYGFDLPSGAGLTVRLDSSYQDDVFTSAINHPNAMIENYTVSNAKLMWRSPADDWQASFEIMNLTDEIYFENIYDRWFSSAGQVGAGIAMPRNYALRLRRNFGL